MVTQTYAVAILKSLKATLANPSEAYCLSNNCGDKA